MDLEPYAGINPCGMEDLAVTQLRDLGVSRTLPQVRADLRGSLDAALARYLEVLADS